MIRRVHSSCHDLKVHEMLLLYSMMTLRKSACAHKLLRQQLHMVEGAWMYVGLLLNVSGISWGPRKQSYVHTTISRHTAERKTTPGISAHALSTRGNARDGLGAA